MDASSHQAAFDIRYYQPSIRESEEFYRRGMSTAMYNDRAIQSMQRGNRHGRGTRQHF